jgi:hypothetical protein
MGAEQTLQVIMEIWADKAAGEIQDVADMEAITAGAATLDGAKAAADQTMDGRNVMSKDGSLLNIIQAVVEIMVVEEVETMAAMNHSHAMSKEDSLRNMTNVEEAEIMGAEVETEEENRSVMSREDSHRNMMIVEEVEITVAVEETEEENRSVMRWEGSHQKMTTGDGVEAIMEEEVAGAARARTANQDAEDHMHQAIAVAQIHQARIATITHREARIHPDAADHIQDHTEDLTLQVADVNS